LRHHRWYDHAYGRSEFGRDILALCVTRLGKALSECREQADVWFRRARIPITGTAACCAHAASGHATAAPPSSVMNSRRLM
jgi:hypothetical protein